MDGMDSRVLAEECVGAVGICNVTDVTSPGAEFDELLLVPEPLLLVPSESSPPLEPLGVGSGSPVSIGSLSTPSLFQPPISRSESMKRSAAPWGVGYSKTR